MKQVQCDRCKDIITAHDRPGAEICRDSGMSSWMEHLCCQCSRDFDMWLLYDGRAATVSRKQAEAAWGILSQIAYIAEHESGQFTRKLAGRILKAAQRGKDDMRKVAL